MSPQPGKRKSVDGSIAQSVIFLFAGCLIGGVGAFLAVAVISKQRLREIGDSSKVRLADLTHRKTQIASELAKTRAKNESLRAKYAADREKLASARGKIKQLAKNVLMLRDERENTKLKIGTLQKSLDALNQQTMTLAQEFEKAGKFYKSELRKSFEKRKVLQQELEAAQAEQEAFAKRVEASVLEHGSPEEMIMAAQLRLGQIDVLERSVQRLETENAELREEAKRMKRERLAIDKDLTELEELKINNQQLVRCVESLENSRQQHEQEAARYKDQADESEQLSDTLRLRLDDLEKNFAAIEEQQHQAIKEVRKSSADSSSANDNDDADVVDLAQYSNRR